MTFAQIFSCPAFAVTVGVFTGLCVGSFLNVVIHRVPLKLFAEPGAAASESVCLSRSRCPRCRKAIAARDNVPLLSYLLLRGRCRHCRLRISARYPLIEGLAAVLFGAAGMKLGLGYAWVGLCLLSAFLIALSAIDVDHLVLPDVLTLPLLGLGIAFNAGPGFVSPAASLAGAVAGYVFLWLVAKVSARIVGREALGMGDAKLLAALGAWLGFNAIVPIVVIAVAVAAALMMLARIRTGARGGVQVPFGPSLAVGALCVALHVS
ncbi:A24 family peptidase [Burkholderia sp. BCC0044]|uniref:prepilin peptidase n=1 Tax=Burkholderia sp. BCC0044 TaxID=2676295 RepID=UPI00158B05D7|nr:A24 family peptidase [Burkholderia sp. BCC0044]